MRRSLVILSLTLSAATARADDAPAPAVLCRPLAWSPSKPAVKITDPNRLSAFSRGLGAPITALENHFIDAGGLPLQVNRVVAADEVGAAKAAQVFAKAHKDPIAVARRGTEVFEFRCRSRQAIHKARSLLGLASKAKSYKVSFAAAPLARVEPMAWNRIFNALMAIERRRESPEGLEVLEALRPSFACQESLTLPHGDRIRYTPGIKAAETKESGAFRRWGFQAIPTKAGVPRLPLEARVSVRPFTALPDKAARGRAELRAANAFWPVTDPVIQKRAASIVEEASAPRDKAERILTWVHKNLRYSGKVVGSRYGVRKVLEQGYGHCWDKSDVFVTLCRAAGLPARQILGWLRGVSGHVWAEVFIAGAGWVAVDPTASWLGCSEDYIPLIISEDGVMPLVYWDRPRINAP